MNSNRLKLQALLEELLGTRHVYYQSPESLKMEYPAIRYSKQVPDVKHADDVKYLNKERYEIIVIDKRADNAVIQKILELPYSSFERHYTSDNLHHDVINLYY